MQIGMIGLGKMGSNMVRRLMRGGHTCVVHDISDSAVKEMRDEGADGSTSLAEFVRKLKTPRTVWMMVPADAVDETINKLVPLLEKGDILIDGGNSHYANAISRAEKLTKNGIHYNDCGTSGGVSGLDRGYCLMVGGEPEIFRKLEPIFSTLAPGQGKIPPSPGRKGGTAENGYLHCGPHGAGHFVKMIHNGIEYGLMAAYAEGLNILMQVKRDEYDFRVDDITELWRRGSVISSWLLDLTAEALAKDPKLEKFHGNVADSGEGRWTLQAAIEAGVPAHVLAAALFERFESQGKADFQNKILSAMRYGFGGHTEKK